MQSHSLAPIRWNFPKHQFKLLRSNKEHNREEIKSISDPISSNGASSHTLECASKQQQILKESVKVIKRRNSFQEGSRKNCHEPHWLNYSTVNLVLFTKMELCRSCMWKNICKEHMQTCSATIFYNVAKRIDYYIWMLAEGLHPCEETTL